jgi:hypothetical protein
LPKSSKPIFDPLLGLDPPTVLGDVDSLRAAASFSNLHTFPSERATQLLQIITFGLQRAAGPYRRGQMATGT